MPARTVELAAGADVTTAPFTGATGETGATGAYLLRFFSECLADFLSSILMLLNLIISFYSVYILCNYYLVILISKLD